MLRAINTNISFSFYVAVSSKEKYVIKVMNIQQNNGALFTASFFFYAFAFIWIIFIHYWAKPFLCGIKVFSVNEIFIPFPLLT